MGHQLLGQEAPVPPAAKKPQAPFITDCHRNVLDRLGRAFTEARPLAILIGEGKSGASYLIRNYLAGIEGDVAFIDK